MKYLQRLRNLLFPVCRDHAEIKNLKKAVIFLLKERMKMNAKLTAVLDRMDAAEAAIETKLGAEAQHIAEAVEAEDNAIADVLEPKVAAMEIAGS